jgi:hypothetical protein
MPCMCGDLCCPSCGPAQGNVRCPVCRAWASEGCDCTDEEIARAHEQERLAEEEYARWWAEESARLDDEEAYYRRLDEEQEEQD